MSTGVGTGARGCGKSRLQSAIYVTCGLSPIGSPLSHFIIDPPQLLPPNLVVPAIGVTHFTKNGVTHIVDKVGREHYPNAADFVEEVKRMGLSRHISSNFPFELLTADSRILLVHDRAYIENCADYYAVADVQKTWLCPKQKSVHAYHYHTDDDPQEEKDEHEEVFTPDGMCAGLWWQDVEPIQYHEMLPRKKDCELPSFKYEARRRPFGVQPVYIPAFFMTFPVQCLDVVKAKDGSHAKNEALARKANLDVEVMDR